MATLKKKELNPEPMVSRTTHHDHLHPNGFNKTPDMYTNVVGRFLGEATNLYGKVIDNPVAERITNGILQKGWRALLMVKSSKRRAWDGLNQARSLNPNLPSGFEGFLAKKKIDIVNKPEPRTLQVYIGHDLTELFGEAGKKSGYEMLYQDQIGKSTTYNPSDLNQVILYKMSAVVEGQDSRPFIPLQIRPNSIEGRAETSWATLKPMGRNTPMYHYLGSEDLLQINTSWYMKGKPGEPGFNPYWVINQCRLLKSWSMSNGYVTSPPIIYIEWGRGDIFQGELWILTSATYHLNNFSDKVVVKHNIFNDLNNSEVPQKQIELLDFGLVPFTATQELIFKRVSSHNLLTPEIANPLAPQNASQNV